MKRKIFFSHIALERHGIVQLLFISGRFLQSIHHRIQLLRNHSYFKMNPKLISSLLPFTCFLLCAMLSLAKFLPTNSWSMTNPEYKRLLQYKYYSEVEEYFNMKISTVFVPSSHANFETRDRKGTCETHL